VDTSDPKDGGMKLNINNKIHEIAALPDMPLLWAIRDLAGLTGTKYGCGLALCGACTVHLDGQATRSCVLPVSAVIGRRITTIEGIGATDLGRKVQEAWIAEDVPQCGYCQSGQIMSAVALLASKTIPSEEDIANAMNGNLCRCGTYDRIRKAIHRAAGA
jgi:isoquinoline 1-oxidoreductase alpha subunit